MDANVAAAIYVISALCAWLSKHAAPMVSLGTGIYIGV